MCCLSLALSCLTSHLFTCSANLLWPVLEQYGHSWSILVGAPALLDFGGFGSLPVLMGLLPQALGLGIPKVRERAALVLVHFDYAPERLGCCMVDFRVFRFGRFDIFFLRFKLLFML